MGKIRIVIWALTFALAASVGIAGGVLASASSDGARTASAEAKAHCKPLLEKAKKKKGKARERAMAKYRKCLDDYVPTTTTDGGTTTGGGSTTPTQEDPKAVADSLIRNQQFYRPFASSSSSGDDTIRFCEGTWWRRYTYSSSVSTSDTFGSGAWEIKQVEKRSENGLDVYVAIVRITGSYDNAPVDANIAVAVSPQTSQTAIDTGDGLREFQRGQLGGGC